MSISKPAQAALEAARQRDTGKFGVQVHADPGVVAMAPRFPNELWPVGGAAYDAVLFYQWQRDVLASITPFLETDMMPVSWREHATAGEAGWEPHPAVDHPFETLTSTLRVRDADNVEYEITAASRVVPYRAGPDFDLTELTFEQVRAATPALLGDGVFFDSADNWAGMDPNDWAMQHSRAILGSDYYSDENAVKMKRMWEKATNDRPDSDAARHYRGYLDQRRLLPAFVKACEGWPEFERRLGHKVDTVVTVNRAPGHMPEPLGRLVRETTTFVTSLEDARKAAIPRNQAMLGTTRPEDFFGDDRD